MKRTLLAALLLSTAQADDGGPAGDTLELRVLTTLEGSLTPGQALTLTFRLSAAGRSVRLADCRCAALLYPGEPSARLEPTRLSMQVSRDDDTLIQTVVNVGHTGRYSVVLDARPVIPQAFAPLRATLRLHATLPGESP